MTDKMTTEQMLEMLADMSHMEDEEYVKAGGGSRVESLHAAILAHLTDPSYVRVPVELVETLRDMTKLHIEKGTVLTVHMNDVALHLDMLATKETPNE